ncbi:MAG: protein kinase [Planctomycetes bacterium]|nr:protein kinase [Planctomycetota bacterium]
MAVVTLAGAVYGNFILERGDAFSIGRSLQADLSVDDLRVSRRHCTVENCSYGIVLKNLRSANGTFVNGQRIEAAILRPGDRITVGNAELVVSINYGEESSLDQAHTCETCGRSITLMTFAEGEVVQLDGMRFVCPQCREKAATPEFSIVELDVIGILAGEGFEVQEKLSVSGVVPIYRARKVSLDQIVAIKALPLSAIVSRKKISRFAQEARVQARLRHRNIVSIYDVRKARDLVYIVMELIEGETLLQLIERTGTRLAVKDTLRIGYHIARALSHANERGIIHRDVKPSNVMIGLDHEAKLIDFGLGKNIRDMALSITSDGETLGTLGYMAPEQLGDAKKADHRADIYGLGATLYHCLAGRPPFDSVAIQELRAAQNMGPQLDLLTGVPLSLVTLIARCLHADPARRPQSAEEAMRGLEQITGDITGIDATPQNVEFLLRIQDEEADLLQTWRSSAKRSSSFLGSFTENELIEFLQMVEFNQKTGTLRVTAPMTRGTVHVARGVVVAAETRTASGVLTDEEAFKYLLRQPSGDFEFTPESPPGMRCRVRIGPALLDAVRLRDEGQP